MRIRLLIAAPLLIVNCLCSGQAFGGFLQSPDRQADVVIDDFERETYAPWVATGRALGPGPAKGTLQNQMHVDGFSGERLINTFFEGDATTGTLESAIFPIERNYLSFLIGGGRDEARLRLILLVDGMEVRSATGNNDRPGGSERLLPAFWDVSEWIGKSATLRIVDEATGGWGHLSVDRIVLTDSKPQGRIQNASREWIVESQYLLFPIKQGAPRKRVTCHVDEEFVVQNEMELAEGEPDWWAPMDVSSWRGKKFQVTLDSMLEGSGLLDSIRSSNSFPDEGSLYREPNRGKFHFSPRRGWNNDPNGLVYFRGEYHLFFQHNPYGWGWGNMHWGHAVSSDLIHWKELGESLLPDAMGMMFSGSAVVDRQNSSGLGDPNQPPLVLLYTAAGQQSVQGIASSTDGRNFIKYGGNPVLPQITPGNRDPKVIWYAPTQRWIMVLYVEKPSGRHTIHFFTSPDLKEWSFASAVEGDPAGGGYLFECPDFFELPIDDQPGKSKWVLAAANGEYAIGDFDGNRFYPEQTRMRSIWGHGVYAPQTFSDIPNSDGRRIQIGWFRTETPDAPFNQSMTIPYELRLRKTGDHVELYRVPIEELKSLRKTSEVFANRVSAEGVDLSLQDRESELFELRFDIESRGAESLQLQIRDSVITYHFKTEELRVGDLVLSSPLISGRLTATIFCDQTGMEILASDGGRYLPIPRNASPDKKGLRWENIGGPIWIHRFERYPLKSAWNPLPEQPQRP